MPEKDYSKMQAIYEKKYKCDKKAEYNYLLSCEVDEWDYMFSNFEPLVITMGGVDY